MANTPTIQVDQLADAIITVSAPTDLIRIVNSQPASDIDFTTNTQIIPSSGTLSFNVPRQGTYELKLDTSLICTTLDYPTAQLNVVFDEGEAYAQSIGYDSEWQMVPSGYSHSYPSFSGSLVLSEGDHTVKVYAKRTAGSGVIRKSGTGTIALVDDILVLRRLTGSSAGGVVVHVDTLASNETGLTSTSATAVPNLSKTIGCSIGEILLLEFNGTAVSVVGSEKSIYLDLAIDGVGLTADAAIQSCINFGGAHTHLRYWFTATAESHTLTVRYRVDSGSNFTMFADAEISIIQIRGGPNPPTPVFKNASGASLLASDSGKIYTNEGATSQAVFNLPTAVDGLGFRFVVHDVDGIQVVAGAGDTIRIGGSVSSAAGDIIAADIGDAVHLVAINDTEWVALNHEGTWATFSPAVLLGMLPDFAFRGNEADGTNWVAFAGTGTVPAVGTGGAFAQATGLNEGLLAVDCQNTRGYNYVGTDIGAIGTNDFVFEAILETAASTFEIACGTASGVAGNDHGFSIGSYTANSFQFYIDDNVTSPSLTTGALTASTLYHILVVGDRSGSMAMYINGVSAGVVSISGVTGSLTPDIQFTIGRNPGQTSGAYNDRIAWVALWHASGWLTTHLHAALALSRAQAWGLV